ncbi:MAG TPA: anthranilate synthase component I family protein, partial [Flavitalea sp.]|nr:anthranilate synthase component I family protein [Flavitalea sp.]
RFISFPIADLQQTKLQMLNWCNPFNICCFLDNHNYHLAYNTIECILAAGSVAQLKTHAGNAFQQLSEFSLQHKDWMFGHFAYDLKNETETLTSSNPDGIQFPDLFFFIPEYVLKLNESTLTIGSLKDDHHQIFNDIIQIGQVHNNFTITSARIKNRFSKKEYVDTVEKLREHILRGDCYEINFCQEFFAEDIVIDPLNLYVTLSDESPNPFSAYYKCGDRYLACMSPERFLKKEGNRILSQPIKGTSKRNIEDTSLDLNNINHLRNSAKERSENIMVVDLVRNDLSKICVEGTVHVDELCEIYTFPQVHQMVSTISGELKKNIELTEAVSATFPMGSMTGAPKKKVMELIEKYETSRRGLFSGSLGYVSPNGDFDFNVVIRSVLYNASDKYLSFHTGSAITFSSNPETEYEECLLKAAAIKKALAKTNTFY